MSQHKKSRFFGKLLLLIILQFLIISTVYSYGGRSVVRPEVKNALDHKEILMKSMPKTLGYYKQQRNSAIENGSRFNTNIRTGDMWQRATQF